MRRETEQEMFDLIREEREGSIEFRVIRRENHSEGPGRQLLDVRIPVDQDRIVEHDKLISDMGEIDECA